MKKKLHPNIIWLAIASLFNDISGEIITRALPLFLAGTLGISTTLIGVIEGIADATSSLLKIVSGKLSDRYKTRKTPTLIGYSLTAVARPLLLLTTSWVIPLVSRFFDRAGKGIRTAPRDALVSDSVVAEDRNRAFGIQRTFDPLGAVIGALIAAFAAKVFAEGASNTISTHTFTVLIYIAAIPSFISVILIAIFVKNILAEVPVKSEGNVPQKFKFRSTFKKYLAVLFVFSLGMSSDAFLLLRSFQAGITPSEIFVLVAFFNLVTTLSAYPAGMLADRFGKKQIIVFGWLFYMAVYIGFAITDSPFIISILFVAYGLYYGLTEGTEKALVADLVPSYMRGAAYGWFNAIIGISTLPASIGFGYLWQEFGPQAAFGFGAGCAMIAAILMILFLDGKKLAISEE